MDEKEGLNDLKVITISGHARNGKDTVAGFLEKQLKEDGHRVLITHYAGLVKYICQAYFGWDGLKDERGRHLLQYVGTDVVRTKQPDFWVDFIISILTLFGSNWDYVIIPDTRFENEISLLKNHGFDVIHLRVERPDFDNGLTEEQKMHPSETSLDQIEPDYIIENDSDLRSLSEKTANFLKEIIYEH